MSGPLLTVQRFLPSLAGRALAHKEAFADAGERAVSFRLYPLFMTVAGNEPPVSTQNARTPSVVVLGTDALLAALPATPVQLAHACLRAGYQQVVPASWGDELVAQVVLRHLDEARPAAAIQCSCPLVAHRLLASGSDLSPFLVSVVAPPVALARYLRSVYSGSGVQITYVGRCPGAVHDDIDARLTPQELFALFTEKGIDAAEQPRVFDSVVPPDRRRFYSQPGGIPAADQLWSAGGQRSLAELGASDVASELVEMLLSGRDVLVDAAPRMGCFCSGATEGANVSESRARVVALEPPRAASPVVRAPHGVALEVPIAEPAARAEIPRPVPGADEPADIFHGPQSVPPRRRSPSHGIARPVLGASPITRDPEGRQLPRTYVARRRSTPRPFRVQIDVTGDSVTISEAATVPSDSEPSTETDRDEQPVREREVRLLVTPVDSNGDAIAADQAAITAEVAAPTVVADAPSAPATEMVAEPLVPAGDALTAHAAPAAAPVEVLDPRAIDPPDRHGPRAPRDRYAPGSTQRTRSDRDRPAPQVRKPITERVVVPPERRTTAGLFRPSARQLGLGLVLVALVIVGSVALGVVLGRWLAQPSVPAAGAGAPKNAPAGGQQPARPNRSTDTSLIDAL